MSWQLALPALVALVGSEIEYSARLVPGQAATFEVEVTLPSPPAQPILFLQRPGFARAQLAEPALARPLRAHGDEGEPLRIASPHPFAWLVEPPRRGALHLDYAVPATLRERPEVVRLADAFEWPFVDARRGLLHTATLFPLPVGASSGARVRLELPEGWVVSTSWAVGEGGLLLPPSARALENDYLAVGDWRRRTLELDEVRVELAVSPKREEDLPLLAELTSALVPAELELFGRAPARAFLFVLEDAPRGAASGPAGSAKVSSLVLSVPPDLAGGALRDELARLVAHEFHHTWGQASFEPRDELRFLQEGFTDYYAYIASVRSGLLVPADFSAELARALGAWLEASRATGWSLVDAGQRARFVSEPQATTLVYRGGMALAALWDLRLRRAREGASLDEFMRALYNDERFTPGGRSPRLRDVERALARFVGRREAHDLVELARAKELPDLVKLFRAAGAELATERHAAQPELDAELEGTVVGQVPEGGEADRVGLRTGDELLVVNGRPCADAEGARRAWRAPREGLQQVSLRRGEEPLELVREVPETLLFLVSPRPFLPLLSSSR